MMSTNPKPLSLQEKLAYGIGDCGANFVFQTQITFLFFFYTDVLRISAAAAGTILMVSRVLDAASDPIVGVLADRTSSRWGRYRPWVFASAVPLAAALVLCYTAPDIGPTGKIVWAAATYNLLMLLYAANNIPYCALSGVITDDSEERTSLASWRFLCAMAATLAVNVFTLDWARKLGRGELQLGFPLMMGVWGLLAVSCFAITFLFTRERIKPAPQETFSIRERLTNLFRMGPWIVLFALAVLIYIQLSFRGSAMLHYFAHYLRREDLFGKFNGVGLCVTMVGVFLAKPLASTFGKRGTFQACLLLSSILMGLFAAVPPDSIATLFMLQVLMQLAFGPTIPLLWTMMADVADFAEWKTGQRSTALAFASIVFGLKLGFGIGAWVGGKWLDHVGYLSDGEVSATAARGVVMLVSIFPATALLLGFIALFFYRLDHRLEQEVKQALRERRNYAQIRAEEAERGI
jgi:GPH family glycoside/pentoside/hexuronide:cation symporter